LPVIEFLNTLGTATPASGVLKVLEAFADACLPQEASVQHPVAHLMWPYLWGHRKRPAVNVLRRPPFLS
jgi:hypothetical protein